MKWEYRVVESPSAADPHKRERTLCRVYYHQGGGVSHHTPATVTWWASDKSEGILAMVAIAFVKPVLLIEDLPPVKE